MTTYQVIMSGELLDEIRRDDSHLPSGFRVGKVIGPVGDRGRAYRVEVEDDVAPADLEGCLVEPTFERRFAGDGRWSDTVIVSRFVAERRELAELRGEQLRDQGKHP
jgi:hypothetical protein